MDRAHVNSTVQSQKTPLDIGTPAATLSADSDETTPSPAGEVEVRAIVEDSGASPLHPDLVPQSESQTPSDSSVAADSSMPALAQTLDSQSENGGEDASRSDAQEENKDGDGHDDGQEEEGGEEDDDDDDDDEDEDASTSVETSSRTEDASDDGRRKDDLDDVD